MKSDGSMKPEFKDLLPPDVHAGSERPPRSIEFQLTADAQQNARLVEIAIGRPDSDETVVAARGAGLEVSSPTVAKNFHSGSRPIGRPEMPDPTGDEPVVSAVPTASAQRKKPPAEKQIESVTNNTPKIETKRPLKTNVLHGICLSLFRDNETPHAGISPLVSELRSDVSYATSLARAVRTYSVTDSFAFVPELCQQSGIDCFPGAALGKYPWLNEMELEMLIRVGQSGNPSVEAVIVGNEVMHRGDFSLEQYIQYIGRVKQQVKVPVAIAELLHSWMEHPELAAEVDILGVQIYPYWGGLAIERAARNTLESVQQLQRQFPGKRVILTEFGWPTAGGTIGQATASDENAARYFREVIPMLNENKIEYMSVSYTHLTLPTIQL